MKLEPGQITLVHGHSGAGISVLLKTVAGLIRPTRGEVLYDGTDIATLREREMRKLQTRTGFMFQDVALWANMPLASNLHLPLEAKFPNLSADERKQIIDEALKQSGFTVDLNKRPVELSLGQQKFLSFLRAIIPGPEALMLDEPLSGMDRHWAEIVINKLRELRARGTTLVFGSHNSQMSSDLADHLVVLHHGQILENDKEVPPQ